MSWYYAKLFSARGMSAGHAIPPWAFPLLVLATGPGLILLLAAIVFTSGAVVSWWIRLWFWVYGGTLRAAGSALSCYLVVWWLAAVVIASGDLALAICGPRHASYAVTLWLYLFIAAPNLLVVVGWWFSTCSLLRRTSHCGLLRTLIAAVMMPSGAVVITLILAQPHSIT